MSPDRGKLLVLIYSLSGLTGLAYEILWARMLALQFGVSIFGVIAVVAAFMGGLGFGSLVGSRISRRIRSPLLIFALLEAAVALFALAMPWLLENVDAHFATFAASGGLTQWYLVYGAALVLLLALPALALGCGFPLVLDAARANGASLGQVYGWNTIGATLGALLPLWLLPTFGWLSSTQVVAAIGCTVAIGALSLSFRSSSAPPSPTSAPRPAPSVLLAYATVGMGSLMLEIGWTRLYGMVLLRTEYVLAILLAVFLLGIGAGSLVARRVPRWFTEWLPVIAALGGLASLWILPVISAWSETAVFTSLADAVIVQGSLLFLVMAPVTLLLGMWLPLLAARYGDAAGPGATLYAANSIGSAAGAVIAGAVLIPWIGTPATVSVASFLVLLGGITWLRPSARIAAPIIVALVAWPVWHFPAVADLLPKSQAENEVRFSYEDAVNITHVVEGPDGQRLLLADLQRMDASTDPTAVESQRNQGRLPLLLHPDPRSVLFLGLGTGISASASLPRPDLERTAVELSYGAIEAARTWFAPVNGDVMDQMRVVRDDARRFLTATEIRYDVIVGDLFHPDLAGRSALLSIQQFRRARDRLADGGLFVQWLALNQFDPDSLKVVLRTFVTVFPDARLFVDGFRLAMVGPKDAFPATAAIATTTQALPADAQAAITGDEGLWTWIGRYWGKPRLEPGPVQDEWAPTIEYVLPKARYRGDLDVGTLLDWLLEQRPKVTHATEALGVPEAAREAFERAYIATDLSERSYLATLRGDDREGQRLLRLAYQANPRDRWIAVSLADRLYESLDQAERAGIDRRHALQRILEVYPGHPEAVKALWRLEQAAGREADAAVYKTTLERLSPLDSDLRAAPVSR